MVHNKRRARRAASTPGAQTAMLAPVEGGSQGALLPNTANFLVISFLMLSLRKLTQEQGICILSISLNVTSLDSSG